MLLPCCRRHRHLLLLLLLLMSLLLLLLLSLLSLLLLLLPLLLLSLSLLLLLLLLSLLLLLLLLFLSPLLPLLLLMLLMLLLLLLLLPSLLLLPFLMLLLLPCKFFSFSLRSSAPASSSRCHASNAAAIPIPSKIAHSQFEPRRHLAKDTAILSSRPSTICFWSPGSALRMAVPRWSASSPPPTNVCTMLMQFWPSTFTHSMCAIGVTRTWPADSLPL